MHEFHARTLTLLDSVPASSEKAVERLDALERERGLTLPASIRAWYSLDGASELLRKGIDGQGISVDELGTPHEGFEEPVDLVPRGRILLMVENQGVCAWAARLDGSDDPPVDIEYDTMPEPEWHPFTPSFSQFVAYCVWQTVRSRLPFSVYGDGGSRETLERICQELAPAQPHEPPGMAVLTVDMGNDPEHYGAVGRNLLGLVQGLWECASDSSEGIVTIARAMLASGSSPERLRPGNPATKAALASLLAK